MSGQRFAYALLLVSAACGPSTEEDASTLTASDSAVLDADSTLAAAAASTTNWREFLPFAQRPMAQEDVIPIIETSDPTKPTHCLYGRHVVLGMSRLGGGYVNFAHHRKNASQVDCADIRGGRVSNEVAGGYGRGWQSAIRDRLHSGRYNPTQAGFMDLGGRPINGLKQKNVEYPGIGVVRSLGGPSFQAALFSDPVYDFTQFENLHPDFRDEGSAAVRDRDGIAAPKNGGKDGAGQDGEVRSEFDYAGAMEVWSDVVDVEGADVFRHVYSYLYQRQPKAIFQFGKTGVKEDGTKVIDETDRIALKDGGDLARDVDLVAGIAAYGIRLNKSAGFDKVITLKASGELRIQKATQDGLDFQVPGGGEPPEDLNAGIVGGRKHPLANGRLAMVCKCDDQGNGRAWGLYVPADSVNNEQQVVGKGDGETVGEDRRFQTVLGAGFAGDPGETRDVGVGVMESQLTKLEVKTYFKGLAAPGNRREAFRQELFLLHGSPKQILDAVAKLEKILRK